MVFFFFKKKTQFEVSVSNPRNQLPSYVDEIRFALSFNDEVFERPMLKISLAIGITVLSSLFVRKPQAAIFRLGKLRLTKNPNKYLTVYSALLLQRASINSAIFGLSAGSFCQLCE
jgi:hypothetical protein